MDVAHQLSTLQMAKWLPEDLQETIAGLNLDNFLIRQHRRFVGPLRMDVKNAGFLMIDPNRRVGGHCRLPL